MAGPDTDGAGREALPIVRRLVRSAWATATAIVVLLLLAGTGLLVIGAQPLWRPMLASAGDEQGSGELDTLTELTGRKATPDER